VYKTGDKYSIWGKPGFQGQQGSLSLPVLPLLHGKHVRLPHWLLIHWSRIVVESPTNQRMILICYVLPHLGDFRLWRSGPIIKCTFNVYCNRFHITALSDWHRLRQGVDCITHRRSQVFSFCITNQTACGQKNCKTVLVKMSTILDLMPGIYPSNSTAHCVRIVASGSWCSFFEQSFDWLQDFQLQNTRSSKNSGKICAPAPTLQLLPDVA